MKELLVFILNNLIENDQYQIKEISDGNHVTFEIKIDPNVIGLIIGKNGSVVKSIRNLLKVRAVIEEKTVSISVEEELN